MSIIVRTWELRDFCGSHGRVIPHCTDDEGHFTIFHCADRSHDDSSNIICSEEQGPQIATMSGILSMKGYVVEFENKDEYLFCTKNELEKLEQESNQEKEEIKKRKAMVPHAARPVGIKITSDIQDRRYQSYAICPDYKIKNETLNFIKIPTHLGGLGGLDYKDWLCEEDCIFPNCPFYDKMHFDKYRYNHRNDYDTWVVEYSKNAPGIHDHNVNEAVESPQAEQPTKEENKNNGMQIRNKKSVRQLCAEQQDCIDFIRNPDNGKVFFECGEILGYVSPNAASRAMEPDATIDAFRFAEVSKDNGISWIPCLMVAGNKSVKYIKETIYGEVKVVERRDGAYAVLDKNDNEIVPFGKYAWIDGFDHGLARVRIGYSANTITVLTIDGPINARHKWGIINKQGEEVLPVIYDNIWNFKGKNRLSTYVESKERGGEEVFFHDLDNSIPYPTWKFNSHRAYNDDYGTHYGEYEGSYAQDIMGYSDDVINDAFEGDPDNYWNID